VNRLLPASFRSRANYALAVLSEVLWPLLWLLGRLVSGRPSPREEWRRGVLLGADHIGDVLYRTASLPGLAEATPGCVWSWLCGPPADEIIEADPLIAGGCVRLPLGVEGTPFLKLVSTLRRGRYDVALCYDTGQYWKLSLATALAGIPARIGYVHKGFSGLVTHPVAIRWPQPFPAYFRDLVAQLAGKPPGAGELRPRISTTPGDEAAASRFWKEKGLDQGKMVLACAFFSRQPKTYPLSEFAEIVRRVGRRHEVAWLFLGSLAERKKWECFLKENDLDGVVLAGELGIRSLAALLGRCRALFAADSGVRHIADAVGIPVVFASNPQSFRTETGVYMDGETDIALADGYGLDVEKAEGVLCTLLSSSLLTKTGGSL